MFSESLLKTTLEMPFLYISSEIKLFCSEEKQCFWLLIFFFFPNVQTYNVHSSLFRSLQQNEASLFPFDVFRIRSSIINLGLGLISMFLSQFKASWVLLPKKTEKKQY